MNKDQFKGRWKELRGQVQERWGKLTKDDLDQVEGRSDQLAGKIQQRYGLEKEKAQKEVEEFARSCGC